jgi:hypothetical protein
VLTWLGRLDDTRDTLRTRTLTSYAGVTRDGALGFAPLVAPSAGGERQERTLGAQMVLGSYVGPGRRILTETRLAASQVRTETTPYRTLPGATVLVRSATLDGRADVTGVTLGGSPFLASDETRWTAEGANETTWLANGRRHRFKALVWGRGDGTRERALTNPLGTYTYNAIDDLAANRPARYTRTLAQPAREGTVWNAAAALAHQWTPSRLVLAALRRPPGGERLRRRPRAQPRARAGARRAHRRGPHARARQPACGFTYRTTATATTARDQQLARRAASSARHRRAAWRRRRVPRPAPSRRLADAVAGTGSPGAPRSHASRAAPCRLGTAPRRPSALPTRCLDGRACSGSAPVVTLLDPATTATQLRTSLDWLHQPRASTAAQGWATGLLDLAQPGTVDANFAGSPRFALAAEGGRPVFVSEAAIDPASGAVSPAESRRAAAFGRVGVRTSDLRGYGGQLTAQLSPDVFRFRSRRSLFASTAYTLQGTRRQVRGFDGAAFGDPRVREWAAAPNDARHVLVVQGGFTAPRLGTVTLFGRAQSGLPFTPVVQGDVDGDGRAGDRAFVPDPARAGDAALADGIRALLADGPATARRCLERSLGRVAARNGCRGPWTQTLNVQWRPPVHVAGGAA